MGKLAFEHLLDNTQSANSLQWSEALRVIKKVCKVSEDKAIEVFNELATETGLIVEERERQTFRFIRLTFCEFFAAYKAVHGQEKGIDKLVNTHTSTLQTHSGDRQSSRLLEVIPFAAGLSRRKERGSALDLIVPIGDQRLTARSFLETKLYKHTSWGRFASEQRNALLSKTEDNWNEE